MSSRRAIGLLITLGFVLFGLYRSGELQSLAGQIGLTHGESKDATVVRAVDGDTLEVRLSTGETKTVRLIGIDTPETVRPGVAVECGGPEASKLMHSLADGKQVRVETDPTQDTYDRYGRLLAYVSLIGANSTLEEQMLSAGRASVYVYDDNPFQKLSAFEEASKQAEDTGKGAWTQCHGDFHSAS